MKKKTACMLLAGAALLGACQSNTKTTVTGALTGVESDTLIAAYGPIVGEGDGKMDTIAMQQGHFTLTLAADTLPMQINLFAKPTGNKAMNFMNRVFILAFPGETLTVEGSLKDFKVTGSDFYTAYNKVQDELKQTIDSIDSMIATATQMQQNGVSEDSVMRYAAPIQEIAQRLTDKYVEQIRLHPDEDVAVYLATHTGAKMEEALELLGDKAKNGKLAALYQEMEKDVQAKKEREKAKENVSEGKPAPDFTLKDLQGKDLTLSSLRGKYVVLDFWGSWCGWCIKGIPDMKKYYAKYKGKMEIVGIDCRDTEEKWKEAVEKHELPWLHVRNEGNPDVSTLYAIEGYPTKIVIDPEGKIAKVVVGEDPAFYEYLDKLFK